MNKQRVGITGIGVICSLGSEIEDVWQALLKGKNGITYFINDYKHLEINGVRGGGQVSHIDFSGFGLSQQKTKLLKSNNKTAGMTAFAGIAALTHANLSLTNETLLDKMGIILGTGTALAERYNHLEYEKRNPKWFLETYPNIFLSIFSNIVPIKGLASTISAACTSGSQAIGNAYQLIRNNEYEIMLAGGVDCRFSEPFLYGFTRLNMMNTEEDLLAAMRPFDEKRNGFVMGEGACILVLESYEHARNRKAQILCEINGYGNAIDSSSLIDTTAPGKIAAMKKAMQNAGVSCVQIDYINAHGTSTINNDKEESIAIKELFKEKAFSIPINSTKSMVGHTFAACGAIESAICAMSIRDQKIHPTLNYTRGDTYCDLHYPKEAVDTNITYCMNLNSGVGGYNTALIFKKE